jgi:hypothetical protein
MVLIMLGLLFSFGPTYVARYFIASTLDDFGIEHDGIKTLNINPWKREVWVGPVRFRTGDADQGQLGELGIKFNVLPVFEKHLLVERVMIRGIDIYLARASDNSLTLNGIPLSQFQSTTAEPVPPADEASEPWGIGLGDFELQNSHLIFKDKTGGTLTVAIDNLRLDQFESWQPDTPGSFRLAGEVNDIQLDFNGQARPFAKQITINMDADARDADLPKIIEYTGPLGLERVAGVYQTTLHHEVTLHDTGRIEGHSSGKVNVQGMDYARAKVFAFAADKAELDLDTRYVLTKEGELQINGQLTADVEKAIGSQAQDRSFGVGQARIALADLSAVRGADGALQVSAKPRVDLQQGAFSGNVQLSMDSLLKVLSYLQSISATTEVTTEQTGLDKWSGDKVILPKSDITVSQLSSTLPKFELNTTAGNVTLDIATDTEASGIKVATPERTTRIDTARSALESLQLQSGEAKLDLSVTGNTALTGYSMKGPLGEGTIGAVTTNQEVDLQINHGNIAVEGAASVAVTGTQLRVYKTKTQPQASIGVGALTAKIKKGTLSVANQQMKWQVDAGTTIDRASVNFAKGKMASGKFRRLELRGARADQNLNIATDALLISGLDVSLTRAFIDSLTSHSSGDKATPARGKDKQTAVKKTTAKPAKPEIRLNRFELTKGARLRFEDTRVQPAVNVELVIKTAELSDVDTRNPKREAHTEFDATINEFTHLVLNGRATNLGPKLNLTMASKLENLELPPYSPYAAEFGGVYLESGQFNTDIDVTAKTGNLDGAIKLNVKDLEFKPLSEADAKRLSEKAGMPIETAAKLLQDPQGNINLTLPIAGTAVAPDVDISSAISKAVGNTLKAVFPPTLIGSMLTSDKKEGSGLTFKPIIFKPGSNELDAAAREYADELATLLQSRPLLALDVCGITNPDDFAAVTLISIKLPPNPRPDVAEQRVRLIKTHGPKLTELAVERTQVVRRYLITDKGLKASQVGECRPRFDPDDTGPPRVDVTL